MDTEISSTVTYDEELQPGYFVQIPTAFIQSEEFSIEAKALYALLLSYAGAGPVAWPGQTTLAKKLGISEKNTRAGLQELAAHSLITIKRRGQGKPNVYHVHKFSLRTAKTTVQERQKRPFKNGTDGSSRTVKTTEELILIEEYSINRGETSSPPAPPSPDKPVRPLNPTPKPPPTEYMDNPAVIAYRERFKITPRLEQRRAIAEQVKDLALWQQVFDYWQLNGKGANPQNIGDMLNRYAREKARMQSEEIRRANLRVVPNKEPYKAQPEVFDPEAYARQMEIPEWMQRKLQLV